MRTAWILWALGLAATASLALVPLERIAPDTGLDPATLRLVALVQPAVLITLAVWIGAALAPRVGLAAPLTTALATGGDWRGVLRRQAGPAVAVGLAVAALLLGYAATAGRALADAGPLARMEVPLATKLLYGGAGEELITRWGLVTLFAWVGWRRAGRPARPSAGVFAVAILLSAALFAAGHLPFLHLLAPDPPAWIVGAVIAGNLLPGLAFGWLFVRHGLETAMIAHALAHLVSTLLS